jgi:hypothetical protein
MNTVLSEISTGVEEQSSTPVFVGSGFAGLPPAPRNDNRWA